MSHTPKKKQLILVRHAHALELSDFVGTDFDRPLSEKGREDATVVTRYLRLIGVRPDAVIASPAIRTRETANIICEQYKMAPAYLIDELYVNHASRGGNTNAILMDLISNTTPNIDILMLVGHNDDITDFARYLSDDGVPLMKKGSLVVLSLPNGMNWDAIIPGDLSLLYYLTPQFLKLEELL